MKRDWLWDRKVSLAKVKGILRDADHPRFAELSALLLSRKNAPKEVFSEYIDPLVFCKSWNRIKRQMRKDSWNNPRIEFWQHVYSVLLDKYKKEGIAIREAKSVFINPICSQIGEKIRQFRKGKDWTQADLAEKIGISQQIISRVEKGLENISIATLKKITDALGIKVHFDFIAE